MKFLCSTLLLLSIVSITNGQQLISKENRTFIVDYDNDQFLMDGKVFRFISGSLHYFRALPQRWQRKLRTLRAAGLNTVTTYVEWSLHNPKEGIYNWEGIANLEEFIKIATEEELFVILRPGPYICAERDMGGFPYWLLRKYPNIRLRTSDPNYLHEVSIWYSVLMTKMEKFLYSNGGNIIMVQVENEYGSFGACDKNYGVWLKNETQKYVNDKAVLFTNDGPFVLRCGKIEGVIAGLDFGAGKDEEIDSYWDKLRLFEPKGPLMNAEYYPGWLTHWQEPMQRVNIQPVLQSFEKMMMDGANINFYMFFGGTNFGFTAGANDGGPGKFNSDVSSYDYDAPMNEAGDPTSKYFAIRDAIAQFIPLPNITVPEKTKKIKLPNILLRPLAVLQDSTARMYLGTPPKYSDKPFTFEKMDQNSGFILYETNLPIIKRDPATLTLNLLRDRAYIYVERHFVGVLSRANNIYSLPLSLGMGKKLQVFVENEGRINYGVPNDFKGILGNVTFGDTVLKGWTMTGFPLEDHSKIEEMVVFLNENNRQNLQSRRGAGRSYLRSGPTIFYGEFSLTSDQLFDTYLDSTGWGKGIVFINGFNLGRYWPIVGPQITLYVPLELLKEGLNKITVIELQRAPDSNTIIFSDTPNLDGTN